MDVNERRDEVFRICKRYGIEPPPPSLSPDDLREFVLQIATALSMGRENAAAAAFFRAAVVLDQLELFDDADE